MSAVVTRPRLSLLELAASTDHKRIARRMIAVSLIFFAGGGLMALLMRAELAEPGLQVVSTQTYNALFTMHGSTMIYLFLTPIALALGLYLVPLQVGARRIAAPRLVLAGFVLYVLGGVAMELGFLTQGGPGRATWIGVDPLSDTINTPGVGMDLWVIGVGVVTLGELLVGACVLATALRLRTPDMTLKRMPVFTWTMVATCLMVCFAFPVLVVAMALLWVDRQWGGVFSASPDGPLAYQHLFWFYGHPVVYVMFFPFVGAVAEVFATFARRPFFGYSLFIFSILAFAALSTSVWAHHMFTTGRVTNAYFTVTSTLIAIPAGIEYFDLLGTLWKGRIRFSVPFLFAAGFFVQFLVGGLTGIWVASAPLDYHANNSYFVVAHFHYTLFAGSAFGLFAALFFWWPKITGSLLRDGLGKVQFWLLVMGTNLTFFPMFFLGQDGMTRRIADYPADAGWSTLNLLSSIGAGVIALAMAVFALNLWVSLRRRRPAGPDPWGGQTLEWATSSPPPPHNFDVVPPVRSYAPLLEPQPAEAGT